MYSNKAYDFYLLRTTTFPVDKVFEANAMLAEKRVVESQEMLKGIFSDHLFIEAVFLSSRDLYVSLKQWLAGEVADAKKVENLVLSLHKYYSRMCTRCTPYGVLAGCGMGVKSQGPTNINFQNRQLRRISRLDMGFAGEIARHLEKIPAIREHIKFYANTSVYLLNNRYRYVEYTYKGTTRVYSLSSLKRSKYLDIIYRESRTGVTKFHLLAVLEQESLGTLSAERIEAFIENLIGYQFLVSELDIRVTGQNYADFVTQKLEMFKGSVEQVAHLALAQNLLNDDNQGTDTYLRVEELLNTFTHIGNAAVIQTDLFYDNTNYLNETVIKEITRTAEELSSVTDAYKLPAFEEFKQEFIKRYDQQEVSLVLALDAELGIGYGNAKNGNIETMPLIRGLAFPASQVARQVLEDPIQKLRFKKFKEHSKSGHFEVEITEDELLELSKNKKRKEFASTSFIMGNLLGSSACEVDKGAYQFHALRINTPYAGKIPARFAVGNKALEEQLKQCLLDEQEASPNAILAEILHVPDDRLCNIIIRPVLREYEIPYLCNSSVKDDRKIHIDDLYIRINDGKLILKSKSLNKEILPRMTNSHNASMSIGLYKFLSDLQFQHVSEGFDWEWGNLITEAFLPRVVYKKFILSRARWLLSRLSLLEQRSVKEDVSTYFSNLRQANRITRYVLMQENDNELFIDMDSSIGQQHLLQKLKNKNVILVEYLATRDNCFIEDAEGNRFTNEIVIPVKRDQSLDIRRNSLGTAQTSTVDQIERNFLPGSKWLYMKIYGGNKMLEHILVNNIIPVADKAMQLHEIDKWFFIKYNDPASHLRVRFYSESGQKPSHALLDNIYRELEPFVQNQSIQSLSLDTYGRELERYGWRTMEASESVFSADSIAIGQVVALILRTGNERLRWLAGAYSVDNLLDSFGYSIESKLNLLKELRLGFFYEFNQDLNENESDLLRNLNDKYRKDSSGLEEVLLENENEDMQSIRNIFRKRGSSVLNEVLAIQTTITEFPGDAVDLNSLLASFIHMSLNRLFITKQRTHELVLYHYLSKHYTTLIKKTVLR